MNNLKGKVAIVTGAGRGIGYAITKSLLQESVKVVATELIPSSRPNLDLEALSTPEEVSDIILFLLKNRNNSVIDEITIRRHAKEPWI